ncbi:MAG: alpha/beta fold hydrolase [Dehalococcoidia bacterium]|nr:alpha/beta fold hydrolase [Dehalococcoidia bacterium]
MKWIRLIRLLLTGLALSSCAQPIDTSSPQQSSGELEVEHRFVEAAGIKWHYVEAGVGEPVVFLHGLPESWFSWHYQIAEVSKEYRVIAVDLKGYGQSDKRDGDYTSQGAANELIALFDTIGLEEFSLVTHDWGTVIGDHVVSSIPDRIVEYVRMQAPVLKIDPTKHPQFELFRNQDLATSIMS